MSIAVAQLGLGQHLRVIQADMAGERVGDRRRHTEEQRVLRSEELHRQEHGGQGRIGHAAEQADDAHRR